MIGKGGFGAVFAAKHSLTGQEIVLKVMRPEVASDPIQVKRFLNEARISSQLSHPNTVRTFDFGQTDDGLLTSRWSASTAMSSRACSSATRRSIRCV